MVLTSGDSRAKSTIAGFYFIGHTPDEILNLFKKYAKTIVKLNGNIIRKELKNSIFKHKLVSQGINSGEFIEKLLKAVYAKNYKSNLHAPKSHDLDYLAEKMNLETTEHQKDLLITISRFNLEARYDDYKKTFENKCNDEYTENQIKNIRRAENEKRKCKNNKNDRKNI